MSDTLDAILARLDEEGITSLLTDAVAQYSPSYAEEPAMAVFAARLQACGISYLRQPVMTPGVPAGDQRANLIIELGPQPAAMMWVGHVDTVALIDDEEQLTQREGDILHGLGTADMKSGCAAIIEALVALVGAGVELRRGLRIALVVGEEEYGDGSEALLQSYHAPLVVIGEPTGLLPCINHYGYYECRLQVRGTRAHAALPEVGASAIHAMLVWMQHIFEAGHRSPLADTLTINPREIRGGAGLFAVAENCEAAIDFHVAPGVDHSAIDTLIENARQQALLSHPDCHLQAENVFWAPGYANAVDTPALRPLHAAYQAVGQPWEPVAFRSHSDGSLFFQQGAVPVICGPGRLEVAHTRGEHVALSEVHQAARLYAAMMHEVCVREGD